MLESEHGDFRLVPELLSSLSNSDPRLHRANKLKLEGEWAHLQDPAPFASWLKTFRDCPWVVFIEPRQVTLLRWIELSEAFVLPASLSRSAGSEAASVRACRDDWRGARGRAAILDHLSAVPSGDG